MYCFPKDGIGWTANIHSMQDLSCYEGVQGQLRLISRGIQEEHPRASLDYSRMQLHEGNETFLG